jgi:energy-coupling factor transporter ATP-binding protein EcfA2
LLYWLADDAAWPTRLCEKDAAAVGRLSALKEHARQHTYTPFRDPGDLPFFVIRDVLAKIRNRLTPPSFRPRQLALPGDRRLQRPIGMEFLTSADRRHLYGRDEKIRELLGRIDANQITLLLGNSGSGKTSLIHAGLLPTAIGANWFPIYTRPLGLPRSDVVSGLLASVFEGPHSYRGALLTPVEQAAAAVAPQRLLLIVDQFEDILTAREEEEAEGLVGDLRTIRYLGDRRIRVLVSYRADLEARLGRFWQLISGSPEGLARVYVAGISSDEAWKSIESACRDLRIKLELSETETAQIRKDLESFSATHGEDAVYPPYVQMFIDHIWRKTGNRSGTYRFEDYVTAGAMEGVTAGYLKRQLAFAHDTKGYLKSALVSLVRSYGVKAQKSLAEIATDMGLVQKECEVVLEKLIDLRLVRHVTNLYEVAHDFLAREISAKLVDSEEQEFKRLRELLSSKAATFTTTRSLLSVEELLMLFKYKDRVLPSDGELKLILASWAGEGGPGLYSLIGAPPSRLVELIRAEEGEDDIEPEDRAMLALLRCKVSGSPLQKKDWSLFRRYRLGMELAGMLSSAPLECPDKVIEWALRSKHRTVRDAALEAVTQKVSNRQRKWIAVLSRSSSQFFRTAYEQLALRNALPLFPSDPSANASRPIREFGLLQRIARSQSRSELRASLAAVKRFRPRAGIWLFAKGIQTRRNVGLEPILKRLPKLGVSKVATLMNSVDESVSSQDVRSLLEAYVRWNRKEAEHWGRGYRLRAVYEDKASTLAMALLRIATKRELVLLRNSFQRISLTPSAQYYALALIRIGKSSDVLKVIRRVARADHDIRYWFQIEMGRIVEKRMAELGGRLPGEFLRVHKKKGFWEDSRNRRSKFSRKDLLPLKHLDNRTLYLRLVAHAMIGAARRNDLDILKRLAQHDYRMIARAAAIRLARVAGDAGIRVLQSAVDAAIEHGNAKSFGLAVRDAEIQKYIGSG